PGRNMQKPLSLLPMLFIWTKVQAPTLPLVAAPFTGRFETAGWQWYLIISILSRAMIGTLNVVNQKRAAGSVFYSLRERVTRAFPFRRISLSPSPLNSFEMDGNYRARIRKTSKYPSRAPTVSKFG